MTTFNLEKAIKNCQPEVFEFLPPRHNNDQLFVSDNVISQNSPLYFRYKDICSTLLENIILPENEITRNLSPGKFFL